MLYSTKLKILYCGLIDSTVLVYFFGVLTPTGLYISSVIHTYMKTENIRPEGFENEKKDCAVRALSLVANLPYEKVHLAFQKCGRKNGKGIIIQKKLQKVCKILNLTAKQIKRSGSVNKLIQENPIGHVYCTKRGHAFALINGVVHDLNNLKSHVNGAWIIKRKIEDK